MRLILYLMAAALWGGVVHAQTDRERSENVVTCLAGKFPTLCKRAWLTSEQRAKADDAERRENLKTCLTGRYPSLCKKGMLSKSETEMVIAAEKRENFAICLTGRYRSLCKKELLSADESIRVSIAEKSENLRTCLDGRYPTLCDKRLLSGDQLKSTMAAEQRAAVSASTPGSRRSTTRGRFGSSGCETDHWIDSVSSDGGIIKLEDGSIWQVSVIDRITSTLWLPISDIVACDDKLINTDDNESVEATRLR